MALENICVKSDSFSQPVCCSVDMWRWFLPRNIFAISQDILFRQQPLYRVSQKSLFSEFWGQCWGTRFWTTLKHPGYLGPFGILWPKKIWSPNLKALKSWYQGSVKKDLILSCFWTSFVQYLVLYSQRVAKVLFLPKELNCGPNICMFLSNWNLKMEICLQ